MNQQATRARTWFADSQPQASDIVLLRALLWGGSSCKKGSISGWWATRGCRLQGCGDAVVSVGNRRPHIRMEGAWTTAGPQAAVLVHSLYTPLWGPLMLPGEPGVCHSHGEPHAQQQLCVHHFLSEDGLPTGTEERNTMRTERGIVHKFGFWPYVQVMPGPRANGIMATHGWLAILEKL